MGVRQPAAAGVQREIAARRRPLVRYEIRRLAPPAEPQRLQRHHHGIGKGIVNHRQIQIAVRQPGPRHRPRPRFPGRRNGVRRHLADDVMVVGLAAAQHPDRLLAAGRRPFRRGNDHRRPAVGHQTAVQQMKRPRHPPRVVVIIETHRRVVHLRHRVKVGPLAGSHRDFRHPLPRPFLAIFVHIAGAGHRVVDRGADNPVRRLVLRRRQVAVGRHPHPGRAPRLPVGNQRRLAVPRPDGRHRMGHMNDKG